MFQRRLHSDYLVDTIRDLDYEHSPLLSKKLMFLQLHFEDIVLIRNIGEIINRYAHDISLRHYEMISRVPEVNEILQKYSYEQKFKEKYEDYIRSLAEVKFDHNYISSRKTIGKVHAKIRLTADWFTASYSRVYEFLVPVIIHKLSPKVAAKTLVSLQKLLNLDSQIALEAYQEAHDFKFVETNSEIIEAIIQIDQVSTLLDSVHYCLDATTNISSATEQLSESIQEIASHSVSVAEKSDEMVMSAEQGRRSIVNALEGMMRVSDEISDIRQKFIKLNEAVSGMTNIASFINQVAEQTNLLSLNAAIEAARAGEEGKGFAVVANEVRKLADQTTKSVDEIRSMIDVIQVTSNDVNETTAQLELEVKERGAQTKDAIHYLDQIVGQMSSMASTTSNIASIIEEQAAATDEISHQTSELRGHISIIEDNARITGKSIYDVSVTVNKLRSETIEYMGVTSNTHMARVVKTDHLLWRWWVYNAILGFHRINKNEASNAHVCRLGKWYDALRTDPHFSKVESFKQLDAPHQLIHKQVYDAISSLEQGERKQALAQLDVIKDTSTEVVSQLDQLFITIKSY